MTPPLPLRADYPDVWAWLKALDEQREAEREAGERRLQALDLTTILDDGTVCPF